MANRNECDLHLPFKQLQSDDPVAFARQLSQNMLIIERWAHKLIRECLPEPAAGLNWWMARTIDPQTITHNTLTPLSTWDEFQSGGDGDSWTYDGFGNIAVPAGVYAVSGGGQWLDLGASVPYLAQSRFNPVTDIVIGSEGETVHGKSPLISFAGVDFSTSLSPSLSFEVMHQHGSDRDFDNAHWLVMQLETLPASC